VLDEGDLSRSIALLLVPREAEPVRRKGGDDVGELVAVDVVDFDVPTGVARPAEGALMKRQGVTVARLRAAPTSRAARSDRPCRRR
jgi:hypothetical protein